MAKVSIDKIGNMEILIAMTQQPTLTVRVAVTMLRGRGYVVGRKKYHLHPRQSTIEKRMNILSMANRPNGVTGGELMLHFDHYPIYELNHLVAKGAIQKERIKSPRNNPLGTAKHKTGIRYFVK